jgi:hypothetical protein
MAPFPTASFPAFAECAGKAKTERVGDVMLRALLTVLQAAEQHRDHSTNKTQRYTVKMINQADGTCLIPQQRV